MEELAAARREALGPVGHQAGALREADGLAEIGLARRAELAAAALRHVERDHVIADGHRGHAGSDVDDHARTFVSEDRRKQSLGVRTGERECVGVADTGGLDLDQDFTSARSSDFDVFDREGLVGSVGDGGAGLHARDGNAR